MVVDGSLQYQNDEAVNEERWKTVKINLIHPGLRILFPFGQLPVLGPAGVARHQSTTPRVVFVGSGGLVLLSAPPGGAGVS